MLFDWKHEGVHIAKTGFYVSLVSYVGFWGLELWRTGFVSRFFSVHVFLIGLIGCGIWWGATLEEYTDSPMWQRLWLGLFGMALGVLTWRVSTALGGLRIVLTLVAVFLPLFTRRLMVYK